MLPHVVSMPPGCRRLRFMPAFSAAPPLEYLYGSHVWRGKLNHEIFDVFFIIHSFVISLQLNHSLYKNFTQAE